MPSFLVMPVGSAPAGSAPFLPPASAALPTPGALPTLDALPTLGALPALQALAALPTLDAPRPSLPQFESLPTLSPIGASAAASNGMPIAPETKVPGGLPTLESMVQELAATTPLPEGWRRLLTSQ